VEDRADQSFLLFVNSSLATVVVDGVTIPSKRPFRPLLLVTAQLHQHPAAVLTTPRTRPNRIHAPPLKHRKSPLRCPPFAKFNESFDVPGLAYVSQPTIDRTAYGSNLKKDNNNKNTA